MGDGTFGDVTATTEGVPGLDPSAEQHPSTPRRTELDEAELVRRAQLGSSAAFEQLVVSRGPSLYRYLAVRLPGEGDARDALQETLLAAWQGLPSLRTASTFWPWLCGIATHKAADIARGRSHEVVDEVEASAPDDDELLDVRKAVSALPEPFRQVLLLRHLLGLSEVEVAEVLGTRVGTVKSRSARARKALEDLLR
ncbi:MAG: RNA polymerase sigma factor [Actinobacteria bacterium]|nr:RNA polymerase sigma factor [Actinomycetota bacterium]